MIVLAHLSSQFLGHLVVLVTPLFLVLFFVGFHLGLARLVFALGLRVFFWVIAWPELSDRHPRYASHSIREAILPKLLCLFLVKSVAVFSKPFELFIKVTRLLLTHAVDFGPVVEDIALGSMQFILLVEFFFRVFLDSVVGVREDILWV